jgi:hypothetical protein
MIVKDTDMEQYGSKRMVLSYGEWLETFLRKVVQKAHESLTEDGVFAMNVTKINRRGTTLEIPNDLKRIAKEGGFLFLEEIKMPLSGKSKSEPILVFKKEGDAYDRLP